ncbi:MAG TPA: VOC family protein [Marmoricola sp.]|nr:VOC family protein [Marmoricola sp.]
MNLSWLTAFLDFRPASAEAGTAFWGGVTGSALSHPRGEHGEFATLLPPTGDPWLRVQRLASASPARVHLDLHTDDAASLRRAADGLGAVLVHDEGNAWYTSPGGLPFCVVGGHETAVPAPVDWGTHRSRVDQVCLDISHGAWQREVGFWSGLTGLGILDVDAPEFQRLDVPAALPLKVLLQRRDDDDGPTRAHLDLASDDPAAEVARLRSLGATVLHDGDAWTTLADPAGLELCVTERRPAA